MRFLSLGPIRHCLTGPYFQRVILSEAKDLLVVANPHSRFFGRSLP